MADFLRAVTEAFKNLLTRGLLSVESSIYDEQAFGNAVVVLAGRSLRIRVIRDRGEVFADAASSLYPDDWFPLQRVIRAVGVSSPPPEGLLTPEQAADVVERYFADLESGLGSNHIKQTRTALAEVGRFELKQRLRDWGKGGDG
jgi:hypothetical protein